MYLLVLLSMSRRDQLTNIATAGHTVANIFFIIGDVQNQEWLSFLSLHTRGRSVVGKFISGFEAASSNGLLRGRRHKVNPVQALRFTREGDATFLIPSKAVHKKTSIEPQPASASLALSSRYTKPSAI
jgi:hypothetical protein